jgi:sugar phosphate isomerase/epimerase
VTLAEDVIMPRPVTLFTGQWADLSLEEMAQKASEWGYAGLELPCWGDHFEIQRALSEPDYCQKKIELLEKYELRCWAISNHLVGQAVCDRIDARHQAILPDYVWGDGKSDGVNARAAEEMKATARAAQKLGVTVVNGFTGSSIWPYLYDFPPTPRAMIEAGFKDFAKKWNPILDTFRECNVRFALEVHPTEIAFDLYTAELALDAIGGREEFGFNFDPSHLHWQGVDPVEFLRRFRNRIYHVHIKDTAVTLNGRTGILSSHLPFGDARRGWDFRSPGHGGIDWEAVIRALNDIGYDGPLSVEWEDCGMDREYGALDACQFVKRVDFEPSKRSFDAAFGER